jgi:hypothetical protein
MQIRRSQGEHWEEVSFAYGLLQISAEVIVFPYTSGNSSRHHRVGFPCRSAGLFFDGRGEVSAAIRERSPFEERTPYVPFDAPNPAPLGGDAIRIRRGRTSGNRRSRRLVVRAYLGCGPPTDRAFEIGYPRPENRAWAAPFQSRGGKTITARRAFPVLSQSKALTNH